jgi:hypothetical protein
MRINEHKKNGCDKVMDFERNPFELKLYPPLRKMVEGVYIVKGGNSLEYWAKENALSKPKNSHPSIALVLKPVQMYKHNRKKEKTASLEIRNEVQKDFIIVHKKCLTKHGGQTFKQVLKPKRILECLDLLKPITREKL